MLFHINKLISRSNFQRKVETVWDLRSGLLAQYLALAEEEKKG